MIVGKEHKQYLRYDSGDPISWATVAVIGEFSPKERTGISQFLFFFVWNIESNFFAIFPKLKLATNLQQRKASCKITIFEGWIIEKPVFFFADSGFIRVNMQ